MDRTGGHLSKGEFSVNSKIAVLVLSSLLGLNAMAQTVSVQDAWVRATVPGQRATGAFMKITAPAGAQLVGAQSTVAGVTQVHEMKLVDGVMSMRAVEGGIELPAGKAVELKPGGYHVMLMDLKAPLLKDTQITLTLLLKDAKGASQFELKLPVLATGPSAPASMGHGQHQP